MSLEDGTREVLQLTETASPRFEGVESFSDLAEVVFSLDTSLVNTCWNPNVPGDSKDGRYDNKLEWLMSVKKYHLDEWWIYDGDGNGYNLGNLARQMNPNWQEGERWTGELSDEGKMEIIKESWKKAQDDRAVKLAKEVGGTHLKLANGSMESGISSAVLLADNLAGKQLVYRGVRNQRLVALDQQASGMLRIGVTETSQPANGLIHAERWSMIVETPEIKEAVYILADQPNEENFLQLISLYKQAGLSILYEESTQSLARVQEKIRRTGISFSDALINLHTELMEGNIGFSPFVASAVDMGTCAGFTGPEGLIIASGLEEDRISPLKPRGSEKLVKGWIDRSEIVAIIPVNRYVPKQSEFPREEIEDCFNAASKEVEDYLKGNTN